MSTMKPVILRIALVGSALALAEALQPALGAPARCGPRGAVVSMRMPWEPVEVDGVNEDVDGDQEQAAEASSKPKIDFSGLAQLMTMGAGAPPSATRSVRTVLTRSAF